MKYVEIKKIAHDLRLFGISETVQRRLESFSAEGQTGEDLLIQLLEDEKQFRKNQKVKILDSKAKFRRHSFIEEWDSSIERGISKSKIKELVGLKFWDEKQNLIIVGPTGCGKTQLAIAIGKIVCQNQLSVSFMSTCHLFEELQAQRSAGKYMIWSRSLKNVDVIIFDDFGLRAYTHEEALFLIDLFEDRYRKKVNIFTSQVDLEGWKSLFEDTVTAQAIVDRIQNPSEKIQLIGASYRARIGKGAHPPCPV